MVPISQAVARFADSVVLYSKSPKEVRGAYPLHADGAMARSARHPPQAQTCHAGDPQPFGK